MDQTVQRAVATDHEAIYNLGRSLGEDKFHDIAGGGFGRMTKLDAYAEAVSLVFGIPILDARQRLEAAASRWYKKLVANYNFGSMNRPGE